MKWLVVLLLLVGAVLAGAYYFGGVSDLNPAEQAAQFRGQIKQGMTLQQVIDLRRPQDVIPLAIVDLGVSRGAPLKYEQAQFKAHQGAGAYKDGLILLYRFTNKDQWEITFDASGKVQSVDKAYTAADLLEGNLPH